MKARTRIELAALALTCLAGLGCEHYEARARVSYPESVMGGSGDRLGRAVFDSPEVLARMQNQADEARTVAGVPADQQ